MKNKAQEIIDKTEEYYLPVFKRNKLVFDHGEGCYLYDVEGKKYLDFLAGIAVNAFGYNYKNLVDAISEQASKIIHCSNYFYTEVQADAVELIAEITKMDKVFLCNSGAEANEGAIKLARKYGYKKNANKYKIISAVHSFHGRTMATLTATGQPHYQEGFSPLPTGYEYVPYGDLKALKAKMDKTVCAVLLEPIQGEGGVNVAPDGYLKAVREICDENEALVMFDEIQCGMARSGKWFAWEHENVKPDVITLAKAIGGGFPMGAFCVSEKYANVLSYGDHGSTFGGNPLSCAAVKATISEMKALDMPNKVTETGGYLKAGLVKLKEKYPEKIKEVRGRGLMLGMEVNKPGASIVAEALDKGLIINCTAECVIRLVPPLIVSKEQIDSALSILDEVLETF